MGRVFKFLLWFVGGFVTVFLLASLALYLFFDPNDFREDISAAVKNQTGRDLTIEGDISLQVFPWLAVEVGQARLGNAAGFGEQPMASFDRASFSVRLLPALLQQDVVVGAADIESLRLNLRVNESGVGNWEDLVPGDNEDAVDSASQPSGDIDVNSIEVIDAAITYTNDDTGETMTAEQLNLRIGRLRNDGSAVPIEADLRFDVQPSGLSGTLGFDTRFAFDAESGILKLDDVLLEGIIEGALTTSTPISLRSNAMVLSTTESLATLDPVELSVLDMHIVADIEPFSYDGEITPRATIAVDTFSLRKLMQRLDVQAPTTADPAVLERVSIDATANMTATAIDLSAVTITLDDTSFSGSLSLPTSADGYYRFDLSGDSIALARYMEPATEAPADTAADVVPVEIPVDLIRPLNARGTLRLNEASLGNIVFENIELGLNAGKGQLRVFPVSSGLFGGTYSGDVRIDVSGTTPSLSVNEEIAGVDLADLAKAMFARENVSGSIDGSFTLAGSGDDTLAIQRDLSGNLSLELKDGTYEGTDVWYELRRARALLKGEAAPEPSLPARTAFSKVQMTGVVTNGIMRSDDLLAELPHMQLTGGGQVDIPAATVDYSLTARILERPELLTDATPEELDEFTEAVIPLKVTGPLTSPSLQPDLEALLKQRVEEEIKDALEDKLKDLLNR